MSVPSTASIAETKTYDFRTRSERLTDRLAKIFLSASGQEIHQEKRKREAEAHRLLLDRFLMNCDSVCDPSASGLEPDDLQMFREAFALRLLRQQDCNGSVLSDRLKNGRGLLTDLVNSKFALTVDSRPLDKTLRTSWQSSYRDSEYLIGIYHAREKILALSTPFSFSGIGPRINKLCYDLRDLSQGTSHEKLTLTHSSGWHTMDGITATYSAYHLSRGSYVTSDPAKLPNAPVRQS